MIELQSVCVGTTDKRILDDLSLVIGQGVTAIVGPSGSGKSTLLRLLNRLDVPDSGSISLAGTDIMTIDPQTLRRRVAMVFQQPLVFPGTVADNLRIVDSKLDLGVIATALKRVGLSGLSLDQEAASLSGGEAQRMALARALLNKPDVLLADEVTSALDQESAAMIDALLVELAGDGMTIVAVTHNREQATSIADEIIGLGS